MYAPEPFGISDKTVIREFLNENAFGALVTTGANGIPIATHLPFLFSELEGEWFAEGHLAKANPQDELLQNDTKALIIVTGASGYVSSGVYTHVNVPTYNYEAVHLTGTVARMDAGALLDHLKRVVNSFENDREQPLDFEAWPKEMIAAYMTEITGFRIKIEKTDAAFKLSQNRNDVDFERIVADLQQGDIGQQLLAVAMQKRRKN